MFFVVASPPPPGSLTFETRPEGQWYHGSDLTCLICHKTFVDFTYYCTHIRTLHQISKEQYNEQYGTGAEAFRYTSTSREYCAPYDTVKKVIVDFSSPTGISLSL